MTNNELRVALYVDSSNISRNGGYGMRYEVLRDFACRGGAEAIRLNAYVSFDPQRDGVDDSYRKGQDGFHSILRVLAE